MIYNYDIMIIYLLVLGMDSLPPILDLPYEVIVSIVAGHHINSGI